MRRLLGARGLILCVLALSSIFGKLQADKVWNASGTPDVQDENLVIESSCTLNPQVPGQSYVKISAINQDISVSVNPVGPVSVSGSSTVSRLFLEASQDKTITFHVQDDFTFLGEKNPGKEPLFIAVAGGGNVVFELDGSTRLSFGSASDDSAGVQLYVIMNDISSTVLKFSRKSSSLNNLFVEIGKHSLLGYASSQPVSTNGVGTIVFDPTNENSGVMALRFHDQSALFISGRLIDPVPPVLYDLILADIKKNIPAGCRAGLDIITSDVSYSSRLLVMNENKTIAPDQIWHPFGYTGQVYGFVLGNNSNLSINTGTYLDYVGLALDQCLEGSVEAPCEAYALLDQCLCENSCVSYLPGQWCKFSASKIFKKRNSSALIVDRYDGTLTDSVFPPSISLASQSAIVFRSGVNCNGEIEHDLSSEYPFTVDPRLRTPGAGNMLLDVEGCLIVTGAGQNMIVNPTKIELLSLAVSPIGGTVLYNGAGSKNFPLRNFAKDASGQLLVYNSGYFFVNDNCVLSDTFLVHTDQNHKIYENDDVRSEPSYVGGELFKLNSTARPRIIFSNSMFLIHTSLASTGLDFVVPNALSYSFACAPTLERPSAGPLVVSDKGSAKESLCACQIKSSHTLSLGTRLCLDNSVPCDNYSQFIFFYNGYAKDNGTGRQMILGTYPGSTTCDCCTLVDQDTHLDVMQLADQSCSCAQKHDLVFTTMPNNGTIIEGVPLDSAVIDGQYSINTIYLGHDSNISIGSPTPPVTGFSCPTLTVDGSYFSFLSRGGDSNCPQTSNVTGQGGIFVDSHGKFTVEGTCGLNMGVMVTKSGDGIVNLPSTVTHYGCGVGLADWCLNLGKNPVIIPDGENIPDYVLNWRCVSKDPNFVPYVCSCTQCPAPQALPANVTGIPLVLGYVDQLRVEGSRVGYPVHLKVGKGGDVRELIFLDSCKPGSAPTAVVALEGDGRVGLGSSHTDVDSLEASIVLGNNGVTLVADGDGRVVLNEDVMIESMCHIVQGPNFKASNRLFIVSPCCRTIRVKNTGVLDLSSFTTGTVEFSGEVKLILEPGAEVRMGTCTLKFSENAGILCPPASKIDLPTTPSATALDPFRVKFIGGVLKGAGQGFVKFHDCSYCTIYENAFVGVESGCLDTDLVFELHENAKFALAPCGHIGGAFQIGNTAQKPRPAGLKGTVAFKLLIDGNNAEFYIGEGAFVGLASVIAYKPHGSVPNEWTVSPAFGVTKIDIVNVNGIFSHNVIWDGARYTGAGEHLIGSALTIGSQSGVVYSLDFRGDKNRRVANASPATMRGGGNLVLVGGTKQLNILDVNTKSVGIMASGPLYKSTIAKFFTGSGTGLMDFWRFHEIIGTPLKYNARCDVGPFIRNEMRAGYVDRGAIVRSTQVELVGAVGITTDQAHTIDVGAAAVMLLPGDGPREIRNMKILA